MKLRLRSIESKQTHRIEAANTCNLQQLKEIISLQLFPSSSSSSAVQHNLLLSLNRKDELCGSSPEESLQSLGVTSGDLIYYTQNPYAFSSQNPNLSHARMGKPSEIHPRDDQDDKLMNTQSLKCGNLGELIVRSDESRKIGDAQMQGLSKSSNPSNYARDLVSTQKVESGKLDEFVGSCDETREMGGTQMKKLPKLSNANDHTGNLVNTPMMESGKTDVEDGPDSEFQDLVDTQMDGSSELSNPNDKKSVEGADEMDVDDDESEFHVNTRFSVPSFLKKVFVKEVGEAAANGGNHKLLVIAVHAVLLESGFVGYDPVSGMKVDGFHLPDEWPSSAFGISLHYTLPEISTSEVVETVVLKFQGLGKFVNIYGSLPKKGFGVHRVCLDEPLFVPALSYVWKKSDYADFMKEIDGSMKLYPNRELFEFWKIVKDGLSYPLLIELCEQVGLVPPPCLMCLPTELKLKILESLPAVDVARVECVCSELRFVASNNDLWRMKYEEEFGNAADSQRERQWKAQFSSAWEIRKKRKRMYVPLQWREPPHFRPLFPGRRDPHLPGAPFVIGGDYDRLPGFGIPQHPGRRIFRRNCDLGRFGI